MKTTDRKNSGLSHVTDVATRSAYSYYSGVMQEDGDGRKDVRGIRRVFAAALLSGVSMLAVGSLSTSGAQAGTCLPAATPGGTVYCLGTFSDTIDISDVEDLTIVVDDAATIDTSGNTSEANGDNIGVLMSDDFDQTVNNYGTVLTSDADSESTYTGHHGISVYSGYAEAVIRNKAGAFVGTVNDNSYGLFTNAGGSEGDNASAVVLNAGTVVTEGIGSKATVAIGRASSRVENSGTIETTGSGAYGMFSVAGEDEGTATATNSGGIETSGAESTGVAASAGNATATNAASGTIEITGSEGIGLSADGFYATVQNYGDIDISGVDGIGMSSEGKYAYATNTSTITVSNDESTGIYADGKYTTVYNSGSVAAGGEDGEDNWGIVALAEEDVTITNSSAGSVSLNSSANDSEWIAAVYAEGDDVTLNNYGLIQTSGESEYADAVVLFASDSITVNNTGQIYANGYDSTALRVAGEDGEYTATINITNGEDGVIAGSGNYRNGIDAEYFGTFTLNNSGDISVDDTTHNNVFAINADEGNAAYIYNYGNITGGTYVSVEETALFLNGEDGVVYSAGANASAVGIYANDEATFVNYGSVTATADEVVAVTVSSDEGHAYAINHGNVTTTGESDATAINVDGGLSAIGVNALTGTITTEGSNSDGISVFSENGVSQVINTGTVEIYGDNSAGIIAGGVENSGEDFAYGVTAGNAGTITTYGENAYGIAAYSIEDDALAYNVLGGRVTTHGDNSSGVIALSGGGRSDFSDPSEAGSVGERAVAVNGVYNGFGVYSPGEDGDRVSIVDFVNIDGFPGEDFDPADLRSYVTTTGDYSHGVAALANGDNEESASALAWNAYSTIVTGDAEGEDGVGSVGVRAYANYGDAWAANKYVSSITTYGNGAKGVEAIAVYGDASASNKYNSTIVTHGDNAAGIVARADIDVGVGEFDAEVYNLGSSITTYGDDSAGIVATAYEDVFVVNDNDEGGEDVFLGSITTYGSSSDGIYAAGGGDVTVLNFGSISTSGEDSEGIVAFAGSSEYDVATVRNSGSVTVTGDSSDAISASGQSVEIENKYDASISSTDGYAIRVSSSEYASVLNAGSITGNSTISTDDNIEFENKYDGTITSTQDRVLINLDSSEGDVSFLNDGSITQTGGNTTSNSTATIRISAYDEVEFENNGTISSNNYSYYDDGFVVDIDSEYAQVVNNGSITATGGMYGALNVFADESIYATNGEDGIISASNNESFAVRLTAGDHAQLDNFGSISTSGDESTTVRVSSQAILSSVVNNYGTISATGYYSDAVSLSGRTISLTNAEGALIEATYYGEAVVAEANSYAEYSSSITILNDGTITGDINAYASTDDQTAYVSFTNNGTVTGDVVLGSNVEEGGNGTIYALNTGSITGDLDTSEGGSYDTIIVDGGTVGGGIYTGSGEDTVAISGAGVSITNGIHSVEGNSFITFAQDDTITFDVGSEGYAISGAASIDFESGTTVFDSLDIEMEEGDISIGEDATVVATGTGFYASGVDETDIFGTLQIASGAIASFSGDVSFSSGSTFHTGITSGVGGVVYANTISFNSESTIYADLTVNQDIVVGDDVLIASASAENGVSDEGATVVDNSILFNFSKVMNDTIVTSGTADELFLRLETDETAIETSEDSDGSPNLDNIADALDEYIQTQPISNPLVQYLNQFATPEEQRAALLQVLKDTLPEESDGSGGAVFTSTDLVFDMIMDRLSGGGFTIAEGSKTGMAAGEQLLGGEGKWAIWGRFGGSQAKYTPSGISGFDADSWGGTIGVDGEIAPNLRLGLSYFYTSSTVDENGAAPNSSLDVTGNGAVAYMSYRPATWYVNGSVGYSMNEFDSSRRSIGGVNVASYDGDQFVLRGEVGKIFNSGEWEFTPNVGLRYNLLQIDSYTETGPLPISIAGRDVESLRGTLGVNARYVAELNGGSKLIPEFGVKLINELADPDGTITGSVVGGGAFSTNQTPRADLSFGLGAGLTFEGANGVSVRVTYDGEYQSDYKEHTLGAAVRVAF
tara:strand:- start:256066 stop:262134 length:6069 start_codon:yes stop_codon:yes gene_type:complete